MSVGKRLKEERKRLGLTQEEIAVQLDVSRYAQLNFEKDINLPGGAYLLAAIARGVDVMYVLSGQRSEYDPSEAALLSAFRLASQSAQTAALAALGLVPPAPAPGPSIKIERGDIGQINTIAGDLQQRNKFELGKKKKS